MRQTPARQLMLWVGLACLFAQLSSTFHLALVEHVRCTAHGEWGHAGDEHWGSEAAKQGEASFDVCAFVVSESNGDHHHDHCLIASESRELAMSSFSTSGVRLHSLRGDTVSFQDEASNDAARIYPFAPKTSPPAAWL